MRPTPIAGSPAASRSRPSRPCRSSGREHVLSDGHWGRALREYMRDYNHWSTVGVLNELLPDADNRVTLAAETRPIWAAGGADGLQPVRQRQAQHRLLDTGDHRHAACRRRAGRADRRSASRTSSAGARMGTGPDDSVVDADHRVWGTPNVYVLRRQRLPHPGQRQPGADDHGAGLATGRARWPAGPRDTERRRNEHEVRDKKPEVVVVTGASGGVGPRHRARVRQARRAPGAAGPR